MSGRRSWGVVIADKPSELAAVIDETREGVILAQRQLLKVLRIVGDRLEQGAKGNAGRDLVQKVTAFGICVDKLPIQLRTLRQLEGEVDADIETGWTVVVRDDDE